MAKATMIFPKDFMWGTATAAHQVEGNNEANDWSQWEKGGHILEGGRSGIACDWWENAERDLDIAAEMGTNAHRLSLEWSRIEPKPGEFSKEAIDRYREILMGMKARGIEPMVTLHHFSNPVWLVELGDFSSEVVVDYFRRYTAKVVFELGDLIPKWVTINEPMVYAFFRYLEGVFPEPNKKGWGAAWKALPNMLHCHAVAYHTIKEKYPLAQVGISKNMPVFEGKPRSGLVTNWWAGRLDWLFNDWWLEGMRTGRVSWPAVKRTIPHLAGSYDFIGVNYYTHFYAKFPPLGGLYHSDWGEGAVVGDGDYGEVYPIGLRYVIKKAAKYERPIYITENGVPDRADKIRPGFILAHLREMWRSINFCYPVMGYYHWSLVDNFEWDRGWTQRFGLIELDVVTQERKWRASGRLYQEICQKGEISSDMFARYAPELSEQYFPGGVN